MRRTAFVLLVLAVLIGVTYAWANAIAGPFREPVDIAVGVTSGAIAFFALGFGMVGCG